IIMTILPCLALLCSLFQDPENLQTHEELGLRVAPGFKVTLFADHTRANDIYAMTLDSKGRVVVTSQGWIKILEDTDGDGKADRGHGEALRRQRSAVLRGQRSLAVSRRRRRRQGRRTSGIDREVCLRRARPSRDPQGSRWILVSDRRQRRSHRKGSSHASKLPR